MDGARRLLREDTVLLGDAASLVGIVTRPAASIPDRRPAVILLGAGLVHRVGPHRLYVKLARALANEGFVVLRFDFSGIGDSDVRRDGVPFERSAVAETRQAMDWLARAHGVERFILMAICSGAGFSFRTACADERVVGVSLINAAGHRWSTSADLHRTLRRHYWRMLVTPAFRGKNWAKLARLDFDWRSALRAAVHVLRPRVPSTPRATTASSPTTAIADAFAALVARGTHVLIVYSEGDEGWDYYQLFLHPHLSAHMDGDRMQLRLIDGANHTFTLLAHQHELIDTLSRWAGQVH